MTTANCTSTDWNNPHQSASNSLFLLRLHLASTMPTDARAAMVRDLKELIEAIERLS